jgi:hypothetical protein
VVSRAAMEVETVVHWSSLENMFRQPAYRDDVLMYHERPCVVHDKTRDVAIGRLDFGAITGRTSSMDRHHSFLTTPTSLMHLSWWSFRASFHSRCSILHLLYCVRCFGSCLIFFIVGVQGRH